MHSRQRGWLRVHRALPELSRPCPRRSFEALRRRLPCGDRVSSTTSWRGAHCVAALLYVAGGVYACFVFATFPRWTVDDAYIVFRYAKHLVEHGQLTWTLGADPVEGYTGVALPLLVAGAMRFGLSPEGATRAIGIASYFATAWTLQDNQRRMGVPEPVRAYVTVGAMIFPPFFAHATSGLETMLFAATLSASFGSLLACHASPRPAKQARLWIELLALSLVRPEGLLLAAVFGTVLGARVWRDPGGRGRALALALGLFLLPFGAYFAWRASYYGRLLPNTYYAKAATAGVDLGFLRTALMLAEAFAPVLFAGLATVVVVSGAVTAARLRVLLGPVLAAVLSVAIVAVQYCRSTLIMGYLFRFQIHLLLLVLPFLGVLLAGAGRWREAVARAGRVKGAVLVGLVAICVVAWPVESIRAAPEVRREAARYREISQSQVAPVGAWVRDHVPVGEAVGYWVDAGRAPYLADEHVAIDFGRLNDKTLARPGITPKEIAEYFFAKLPGALVLTCDDAAGRGPWHDGLAVTTDPRFANYERREAFCTPEWSGAPCEVIYVRRGLELR
jgi:arabinofuranosyltransferase